MNVRIDDAGHDPAAGAFDDARRRRIRVGRKQCRNAALVHAYRSVHRADAGIDQQTVAKEKIELHASAFANRASIDGSMPPSSRRRRSASVAMSARNVNVIML